jgi:cytochrome c oxidase subunit II
MMFLPLTLAAASEMPSLERGPYFNAADVAEWSDLTFWVITLISVFFFVLIMGVMAWFMWKYRRVSLVAHTGGPTHHTPLEVTWTVIPLVLVIAIFWVGTKGYIEMRVAPFGAYEVSVIGQKWYWSFKHPNGADDTNILLVPQGRPTKLLMQSQDVLHALWLPAFRVKQDVVPGRVSMLWFQPKHVGKYDLFCAEYCGTEHSQMVGKVEVLPEAEFEAEIARRADWMKGIPDADLWWAAGPRLYNRCAACHSLDGTDKTGPTWKGLWTKLEAGDEKFTDGSTLKQLIGQGVYKSAEDYIMQSITTPNAHVVQGRPASMPTFRGQLDDRAIRALTDYIKHLSMDPQNFEPDGSLKKAPQPLQTTASAR